jgi:hypothetical protein
VNFWRKKMMISRLRNRFVGSLLALAICLGGVNAQIQADESLYIPIPGGTLDTTTNLIWSYDLICVDLLSDRSLGGRKNSFAAETWVALGDDLVRYSEWLEYYYPDEVDEFYPDGTGGWRLPTLDEVLAAVDSGFFPFHDADPAPGFQLLGQYYSQYQTSTPAKGIKGCCNFHVVNLRLGNANYGQVSGGRIPCAAILVKSVAPNGGDGGSDGGGSGGGKGRKK